MKASILIVGPHPDDQEMGMGGTILALKAQGHKIHLVDMTNGEPTPRGSVETRAKESAAAAEIMGVSRTCLGLPNREVVHSIEARHKLAALVRVHKPDWMFVPYPIDAHPDHVAVTRIAEDSRFDAKLTKSTIPGEPWHPKRVLYYFCTHLRLNIDPTFCIDVSAHMETKLRAASAYASQFDGTNVLERLRAVNAYFGTRIGTAYAEPFFSYEVMGFSGLEELV